jgi:hypothetical protein
MTVNVLTGEFSGQVVFDSPVGKMSFPATVHNPK